MRASDRKPLLPEKRYSRLDGNTNYRVGAFQAIVTALANFRLARRSAKIELGFKTSLQDPGVCALSVYDQWLLHQSRSLPAQKPGVALAL